MQISFDTNVLRWYLRDVYFINGTAYAGKSTMVRLLAERYGMIHCGENYHDRFPAAELSPKLQPNLCYFETMSGWEEFLNRTPEEYRRWCEGVAREAVQLEIAELIRLSAQGRKIIADTNIPPEILREISDYSRVAILLSPQAMSVDRFFDRSDPEKQLLLGEIGRTADPERTMRNFRACIAEINSPESYRAFAESGFFTLVREEAAGDTREETLAKLAAHFGLS